MQNHKVLQLEFLQINDLRTYGTSAWITEEARIACRMSGGQVNVAKLLGSEQHLV